jgi:hypothetical protein
MTKMTIAEAGRRAMAERNARHEVAEAVRAAPEAVSEDEQDTFNVWFEQYRQQSWLSAGCDKDRGPVASAAWGLGRRSSLLRGWLARAALASTTPATTEAATQPVKVATRLTEDEVAACLVSYERIDQESVTAIQRAFAEKNGMTLAGGEGDRG